jgi:hypothetical protein
VFKNIRLGAVSLHIARRQHVAFGKRQVDGGEDLTFHVVYFLRKFKSQSCEELEVLEE